MAKKNRGGLLDNWITTSPTSAPVKETTKAETTPTETATPTPTPAQEPTSAPIEVSPELEEQLRDYRNSHRTGRPKGKQKKEVDPNEGRATFVVDLRQVRKLKYISLKDQRLHKEVVAEALSRYIEEWESKNGKIDL